MAFTSSGALWESVYFKVKLVDDTESNGHILKWGVNKKKNVCLEREILQLAGLGGEETLERMKIMKQKCSEFQAWVPSERQR